MTTPQFDTECDCCEGTGRMKRGYYPWSNWKPKNKERLVYGLWSIHAMLFLVIGFLVGAR